jgi:hypothetical protein
MKKLFLVLVTLLFSTVLISVGFCADGDELTTTSFRVNSSGQVVMKALVEAATTNDTVTAAETGKTFIVSGSSATTQNTVTFTLPTAAAGLTYRFIAADGHATAPRKRIYLDPASTDTFVGCVNSSVTTTFAAGDSLYSPGATGDSVTIVGNSLYWYCTDRVGTWVDGNTSY